MISVSREALTIYSEALDLYRTKEYDAALEKLVVFDSLREEYDKARLLKAYIYRDSGRHLKEVEVLTPLLEKSRGEVSSEDRLFYAEAWSLAGAAFSALAEHDAAKAAFLRAAEIETDLYRKLAEYSNVIFISNYTESLHAELGPVYKKCNDLLQTVKPIADYAVSDGPLRLGIISSDLTRHPVASLLVALFRYHDKQKVELWCYSAGTPDDVTAKLQQMADFWCDIRGWQTEEIVKQIQTDGIGVLFDPGGHSSGNFCAVMAYRPALVQLSGIGYMGTTGLKRIDYFLGDKYLDEEAAEQDFAEKMLVMPETHFSYTPLILPPDPAEEAPVLENGYIIFGCFNNLSKVTDEMLVLWRQIMERIPNSKLLLKNRLLNTADGQQYMKERLSGHGLDIARIELQGFSGDYLQEYKRMDIALDTYPYTGGQTTLEALYMGVPVVSRYGQRHGTRFGYSILQNCGLPELSVSSDSEYVERAVGLAEDKELLNVLHQNLRQMMKKSPLMNGIQWTKDFTELLISVWEKQQVIEI